MRTWTIYLACSEAEKVWNPYRNENFDTYPAKRVARAERQTLKFSAELERRMDERDLLLEMHGKPTPIYDKLKAEGFNPPVSVMLIDSHKLTAEEVAYGLSLMEAE